MPKTLNAKNKLIHFNTRNELDIQLIYNAQSITDNETEPIDWIERLIKISRNFTYIISIKQTSGIFPKTRKFEFNSHFNSNLEPLHEHIDLIKPGKRDNTTLVEDIQEFIHATLDYYLRKLEKSPNTGVVQIQRDINHLHHRAHIGYENAVIGNVDSQFLAHFQPESKFHKIKPNLPINNNIDMKIRQDWMGSWQIFWSEMVAQTAALKESILIPKFKLKSSVHIRDKNFTRWLEQGILNYLEPVNDKMTNEETIIRYLKFTILSESKNSLKKQ